MTINIPAKVLMEVTHPPAGVAAAIAILADIDRTLAKIAYRRSGRLGPSQRERARQGTGRVGPRREGDEETAGPRPLEISETDSECGEGVA